MSYDLRLAFAHRPTLKALREAVIAVGLRLEGTADHFNAVGDDDPPMFIDIDGPLPIMEQEDVDEELLAVVPDPQWDLFISLPAASIDQGLRLATQIAGKLAGAFGGAVFDPQIEKVIFPLGASTVPRRAKEEEIRLVKLTWLLHPASAGRDAGVKFLALLRQHLPAALPRRYGDVMMEHWFAKTGDEAFLAYWERQSLDRAQFLPWLLWNAKRPTFGGVVLFVGGGTQTRRPVAIEASFDGGVMESDSAVRDQVIDLFIVVARELRCFYAAGYVERGWIVERGALATTGEESTHITSETKWHGVPEFPVWLSWFGQPYRDAFLKSAAAEAFRLFPEGLFLRLGETPQDRDQLEGRQPGLPPEYCRQPGEPREKRPYEFGVEDRSIPAKVLPELSVPPA